MENQVKLSFLPILSVEWLIGLRVIEYPLNHLRTIFTLLIISVNWGTYIYLLFKVPKNIDCHFEVEWTPVDRAIDFALSYGNIVGTALCITYGCYYSQVMSDCIQRLNRVDKSLSEVGVIIRYSNQFYSCIAFLILWLVLMSLAIFVDAYMFCPQRSFLLSVFVILLYCFMIHITSVVLISFVSMIGAVKTRFLELNKLLRNSIKLTQSIYHRNKFKQVQQRKKLLSIVRQLHLELCSIARAINESFGPQLLCAIVTNYAMAIAIICVSLQSFLNIFKSPDTLVRSHLYVISPFIWIIFYMGRVILINFICTRTSSEAFKVSSMICETYGKIAATEMPDEVDQFLMQIAQNPLHFTCIGFFRLCNGFICDFIASITTFVVFLVQAKQNKINE